MGTLLSSLLAYIVMRDNLHLTFIALLRKGNQTSFPIGNL